MNNIPAFPTGIFTDEKGVIIGGSYGMTLRDYFAAKAMQGMITRRISNEHDDSLIAYRMADAMMEARK